MRKAFLFILLVINLPAFCQQNLINKIDSNAIFYKADYPDSVYQVFSHTYHFNKYQITITNVKGNNNCSSYIVITTGRDTIYHKCFPAIESLGGCAGVYSADTNNFNDYFFISKYGDYSGRLLILTSAGKVLDINGSSFYISKKDDFVFTNQDSDIDGLTIYNLKSQAVLYNSETETDTGKYTAGERYLCEIRFDKKYHYLIYLSNEGDWNEPKQFVLKFDNVKGTLTQTIIDKHYSDTLEKLPFYNSPGVQGNCNCGNPGMN